MRKIKILIVDDAKFMRVTLGSILKKAGYEVVEASNGAEAVQQYKIERPDLVTMDITMPDMDGITALKNIMGIDKDAKVIMCSAMGQQAMVVDAIKIGAKDFIVKPFQADRVLTSIRSVLE